MANPLLTDEQNRRLANQNSTYNQIMQGFAPVQQQQDDSWLDGLSRGAKAGFGGVGAGLLHAGQAAFGTDGSLAAGFDAMAKNNAQRREWDLADTLSLDYLTNPEGLAYGIGQLAGSMALPALFGAGVAAAVPTGGTSLLGTGALIGAAGAAPMAISEGGNTYAQGLQQGMTEDEAKKAGLTDAAIKLPFYMLSEGLSGKVAQGLISKGLLNAEGKSLGRRAAESGAKILGNAANEAYEEGTENRSSAYALGDQRISSLGNIFNPFDWSEEDKAQAVGVFTPTLALGTLTGGAGHLRSRFDKKSSDVAEEIASEDGGTIEEAPEATVSGKEAFINAIAGQESGGNYNAENGDTGAYGKYQIMPSNWPAWAEEAGIGADAPRTPENQEIVARFKLGQYYDKYGARGAAIAWYGGEGALNYSEEALNRKQGDNGEYPSINEYADEVLGRMGNVADSARIDDTEENYFDESNYTDDTISDSLNPVRGFDVSHLDKGTAQDRNSLLYGERVKKAKPAPASEEVASFNQSLDNSNAQKAPNSLFVNSPRSWDAAERIYKARAKEQAERKARAQAIANIANAQQQSFLNVLRNRAAQQWDNAELEYKDRKQDKLQSLANVINARAAQKWDAKEADNVQKAKAEQEKQAQLQNIARLLDARAAQQWDSAERDANLKQNQAQALANLLNAKAAGQYDVAQQVYANRAKEQAEKQRQQQAIANIINARAAQKFDEAETADKFKFVPQRQSMYDGAMRRNLAAQDKVKPEEQPSVEPTERNGAALDKRNMLEVTLPKVREQHKWDKEHKEYHAERYGESALPQTQLLSTDRAARRNLPKPGIEARNFINDRAEKKSARERMQDAIAFVWKDDPKHPMKSCRRQLNMFRDMRKEYLQPIYDVMAEGAGNGVSRIPIIEFDNQHRGRFYRQSNNSPWYAKYFKEHKKKPTQKAMYDIAEEVAFGENADVGYYAGVQGKELEAIVEENHAQLDPINDYIQTYETLELRLKENPNYGKEQAERINKAEEERRAAKRNTGKTESAESIQTEAKQPAESNQDEVNKKAVSKNASGIDKAKVQEVLEAISDTEVFDGLAEPTNINKMIVGKSKEELYKIAIDNIKSKLGKIFTDPLGNKIYFAPGNTESIEDYALHLIAGMGKLVEDIRVQRVLGVLLSDKTIQKPWAIIRQANGRKMYLSVYRGANSMTNGLIIGVEEGQDGRVVTSMLTANKKGDKKAALREFKKHVSGADEVLYIWEGLTGHSRPSSDQQASTANASLDPSGNQSIAQPAENVKKLNLPKGTTVDVSIVGDNSNIIQVKFNGAQGKGTGGIMGRAGYKWKNDKQVWQARKTEKAMDVAEQLGYTEEAKPQERDYELERTARQQRLQESNERATQSLVAQNKDESVPGKRYTVRNKFFSVTILDGVIRVKDASKINPQSNQYNFSLTVEEYQRAAQNGNRLAGISKLLKAKIREGIENWIEESPNERTKEVRKQQNDEAMLVQAIDQHFENAYPLIEKVLQKAGIEALDHQTLFERAKKAKPSADTFSNNPDALFNSEDKSQQTDKYKNYSKEDIKINKERLATMPDVDGILQPAAKKIAEFFKAHFPKSDYTYETVDFWNNYILEFEQLNKILKKYRQATQQGDLSAADAYFQQIGSSLDRLNNLLEKLIGKDKEEQQAQMRQEFRDSIIPFFDEYNKIVDKHNAKEDAKKASKAKKQQNQGEQEYKYYLNARPADVGTVPKGFIRVDTEDKGGRYGAIYYDRQLNDTDVQQYELKSADDVEKEKAQKEALETVNKELLKSDKLKAQAKNNSIGDFVLAYRDAVDDYLAEHVDENPAYTKLLNNPEIADEFLESESIIEKAYDKLKASDNSQDVLQSNKGNTNEGGNNNGIDITGKLSSNDTGSRRAKNEIRTTSSSEESSGSNGQGSRTLEGQSGRNGNNGVPGSRTAVGGKTSISKGSEQVSAVRENPARSAELSGSVVDSLQEQPNVDEGSTDKIVESVADGRTDAADTVNQKVNEVVKENNLDRQRADRLRKTAKVMPFLSKIQFSNTDFVADRLADNGKQGVMITDGTGTGKTFSGLAVAKEMVEDGKENILIVTPSDSVNNQWANAAKDFFGIELSKLDNIQDAGKGAVITTYANLGANDALIKRDWDLVICDESHYLMNNEQGEKTAALAKLRQLTLHPRELRARAEERILPEEKLEARRTIAQAAKLKRKKGQLKASEEAIVEKAEKLQKEKADELSKEERVQVEAQVKDWEQLNTTEKPKVMFMSATPFAYVPDIDYAEGYLFDYPKVEGGSYNQPGNGFQQFMIEHFGYHMRYNKLTKPDKAVDNAVMEVEFHEWLRKTGALTGHELEIDKDYNRGFLLVDQGVGKKIDEGFEFLRNNYDKYRELEGVLNKQFDSRRRNYLLESIKARESVPIIQQYLKAGKKVVVFYETNVERESFNPFKFTQQTKELLQSGENRWTSEEIQHEMDMFAKERPDLVNLNLDELSEPISIYREAFGDDAMFFNGRVSKNKRAEYVRAFNDDNSDKNLIFVQQDAGNAGISLHDTTGKHQRVLINIGIPRRPSYAIQIEGRIYRLGNKSNAIIRYLTTATNIENGLFAETVAGRASTAENLALGRRARGLRDSFKNAYQEIFDGTWEDRSPGKEGEDVGGKENDRNIVSTDSDYDRAKAFYFARGKKTAKNKAAEGVDYFATPEPVGYKMVQWAGLKDGDRVLEPSAGHGAISRFFSPNTDNTIIEPSSRLAPQAQMNTDNAKLINGYFEDLHIGNKYDAVTMNPPFGTGGKTAVEHVAKAFKHLRNGGRVIAIIPRGAMADKRFDAWYESDDAKDAHMVGEVLLPGVTFERAGTKVATRIVIIDKGGESQGVKRIDLSRINNINELFDNLESVEMPARQTKQADAGTANFANSLRKGDAEGNSEVVTADSYKHTKTGEMIPSAKLNANLSDEEYRKVKSIAGKNGGYYSRYAKAFLFQDNETGRDKFVEEVNGANNTQYSVSSEAVQRAKEEVEAEIRAAFPNGKVEYVNGVPTITMPNGSKFQYSIRENIVVNAKEQRKADAAHGTSGARVQGFWKKFTGNGVQRMLAVSKNSERGTAFHEAMHAAIDLVLTEKEKNALYNYYEKKAKEQNRDVDEVIADAYRDWVLARQRKSGTMFGKLWRKVKDFCTRIKALFDKGAEVERIMQDIESGRVYERGTNNHSVTKRISFSKEEIQGQKGSGTTQVATTRTMYVKALKWLRNQYPEAKTVLDYGAGLGLGTDDMRSNNPDLNIDCYEPNPERWAGKQPPTYTNNTQINKDYDLILNTNVLNVVEKPIRDLIVKDIADHLTMGGKALITTRGWSNDVNAAKNFKPADEHHAIWINKGKNGYVFQKGFDGDELKNYIQELLGDEFVVEKTRPTFGKSSVTITRVKAQPNKSAKQLELFDTDSYQEMPDSYKTLKGSVVKRSKYGVGKQMGSQVYLHKDYVSDVIPKKVWENALKVLSDADSDFEYNCVMYDTKTGNVRFDEAPDFDESREPIVGDTITVKPDGTVKHGHSNYIWHHKWLWVKNDYQGFDVNQSKAWSNKWLGTLTETADGNGIERWNAQLDRFNLERDGEEVHYSVASPKHKIANAFTNTERKGTIETAKDFIKEQKKNWYTDLIDKNHILKSFDQLTKTGLSVYDQVQNLPSTTAGMLKAICEGDALSIKAANQHLKNVKMKYNVTLAMALAQIDKKTMDKAQPKYLATNGFDSWVNAFGAYLGAERLLEMNDLAKADGKVYKFPKGLTEAELRAFTRNAPEQFRKAADMFYKVNDNMISVMEDAQVFSHDLAQQLRTKYKKYCPLLRDFSDTAAADTFINGLTEGGRGIGNVSVPLKKINIEGSERGVLNPLESVLKSYSVMLNRAERNKVGLMAVNAAKTAQLHDLIKEVPEVKGKDGKVVNAVADPKNCIFTVLVNGKKKAYQTTQELYSPIVGYNLPAAGLCINVARMAAHMLRTGATMSPSFIVRNFLRDTIFASISSKNGFIPFVDSIRGALALWNDPAMRAEFEAAGVTEFNFYGSQNARIKSIDAMAGENPVGMWQMAKWLFTHMEAASDFVESSTRMGEFMKAKEKGLSMEEAARAAREVTLDFSRSGVVGEQINRYVPFFNACLQGGDKMARLFREDFVGTSLNVFKYIVLPSMFLMAMNWDKDWYKDLDPDIKANYWCVGRNFRIPKPQEAGVLFGSGIEALFEQAAGKDKEAVENWLKAFSSNMIPGVVPTLFLPILEWQANYSYFKGRQLVGSKYQRLPDELQYNDYTSELSKGIGSTLKVSPMKIDNLVRGYTGTMGALLWGALGEPFAKANNLPEKHFNEMLFVRDFNVTDANLSRPMNEFYGILDKANRQHAGYGVKGKPEAAVKGIRSAGSMISKIRKDIDKITHSSLTPERKRELIDKRKEKMNQIAKQANARYGKYFD